MAVLPEERGAPMNMAEAADQLGIQSSGYRICAQTVEEAQAATSA